MSKIIERIQKIIESEHISIRAFEQRINVSNNLISNAIRKNTDISASNLTKIIEKFRHISANWLLTGEGEMHTNKPYALPDEQTKVIKEPEQAYKQGTQSDESERIKEYKEQIDMQREFIGILRQQALDLRAEVDRLRQQIQEQEQKKKR